MVLQLTNRQKSNGGNNTCYKWQNRINLISIEANHTRVPQGSDLGLILFILFMNDFSKHIKDDCKSLIYVC